MIYFTLQIAVFTILIASFKGKRNLSMSFPLAFLCLISLFKKLMLLYKEAWFKAKQKYLISAGKRKEP